MAATLVCSAVLVAACAQPPHQRGAAPGEAGELARLHVADRVVELCLMVADTDAGRRQGLASRDSLGAYDGMLFVFDRRGPYRFWMKDTTIPLDLVPIAADGKLEAPIAMDPCPGGAVCPEFGPDTPYDRALELRRGLLSGADIDPTKDTVTFERVGTACPAAGDG